jgi:hypothetical protein
VGANDAADKPTKMLAVEPAYVETAGAICIEIRNRLAAPKIDSPRIIGAMWALALPRPSKRVISSSALAVPEPARSDDAKARVFVFARLGPCTGVQIPEPRHVRP